MAYTKLPFLLAILSLIKLSIQQCGPELIGDAGSLANGGLPGAVCYADPVLGTDFEYMFYIEEADGPGCQTFSADLQVAAIYTGIDGAISTAISPEIVAITIPGTTTMFYEFDLPYSSLENGGIVTLEGIVTNTDPVAGTTSVGTLELESYTISQAYTIVNTIATSTITTETDVPSVSVSVITVDVTSTITPPAVTTTSGTATKTVYNPRKTTTKIITVTPPPRTIKKNKVVTETVTKSCYPSKPHGRRELNKEQIARRGQPTGSPEVPLCLAAGVGPPPTTTVVVGTSLTTVASTHYDISIELATSTSTIDTTAPTPTVYSGAHTTITVTKDKHKFTTTKYTLGHRETDYVTSTCYITTTIYPHGHKTPPCTRYIPHGHGKPKTTSIAHHH